MNSRFTLVTTLALVLSLAVGCSDDDSGGPMGPGDPGDNGGTEGRCGWSADLAGGISAELDGEVADLSTITGTTEIVFRTSVDGFEGPNGLIIFAARLEDGDTGTFPISMVLQVSETQVLATVTGASMTVTRFDGGLLEAELTATLVDVGGTPVDLDLSVVAGPPGAGPCHP